MEAQFRKWEADISIVEKRIKETKGKRKRKMHRLYAVKRIFKVEQ